MALVAELKLAAQPSLQPYSQGDFRALVLASRRNMAKLAELLAAGDIPLREWAEALYQEIQRSHTGSWELGRHRIGNDDAYSLIDQIMGRAMADSEAEFLERFMLQIEEGDPRYVDAEGNLKPEAIARRSKMYTGRYRGTANEAMREHAPSEAEATWHLGAVEQHCFDCPQLAALSPYTKDTLFQVPGDNLTPCKFNCHCFLTWEHEGASIDSFKRVA